MRWRRWYDDAADTRHSLNEKRAPGWRGYASRMPYDEQLATRIRNRLAGMSEKTMFGGRVFLVDGNTAVGVYGDDLLVRVDLDQVAGLVATDGVRPFLMGGRATRGFVLVAAELLDDAALDRWIGVARAYLAAQPAGGTGRRRGRTAH